MPRWISTPMAKTFTTAALAAAALASPSGRASPIKDNATLEAWLPGEQDLAAQKILANLLPDGAVLASPSRATPNYYYHWTRDAALTMQVVLDLYEASTDDDARANYLDKLQSYASFVAKAQSQPSLSGGLDNHFASFGEPKFEVSGQPYGGSWGRPQTDGPALRALGFIHVYALANRRQDLQLPLGPLLGRLKGLIDKDLDYTANHWRDSGFDLWEEVRGQHFYNGMVQHRALVEGAAFARSRQDNGLSQRYLSEARALESHLAGYWDGQRGYMVETTARDGGLDYKNSNLDSAIILAALHTASSERFLAPNDDRILATAQALSQSFRSLYPINQTTQDGEQNRLSPAIGRYPEDRYDGVGVSQGNPWYLLTAAMAELHYAAANSYNQAGAVVVTAKNTAFLNALPGDLGLSSGTTLRRGDARFTAVLRSLLASGDEYLARVRFHAASSGELNEEMDRYSGFERGARDLSWNYASLLTAAKARGLLTKALGR